MHVKYDEFTVRFTVHMNLEEEVTDAFRQWPIKLQYPAMIQYMLALTTP